jgi:hypothetical protein
MYCIGGRYAAYARDLREGHMDAPISMQIVGPRTLAKCPPGMAHAYWVLEETVFLNLGTDSRETARYGEHTRPYTLITPYGRPITDNVVRAPAREDLGI